MEAEDAYETLSDWLALAYPLDTFAALSFVPDTGYSGNAELLSMLDVFVLSVV
jgi:hypothetical protein